MDYLGEGGGGLAGSGDETCRSPAQCLRQVCTESLALNPVTPALQKVVVYETKSRIYVVGSDQNESRFRVLKIDRTDLRHLDVVDDNAEYSKREIQDLLLMIDDGNKGYGGLHRTISAFGIIGFIRFHEGFYMVLATKRRRVAQIGGHFVYKVEDTALVSVAHPSTRTQRHPDEARYLRIFQNVDLSSNFYFSHTYDISHTFQHNVLTHSRPRRPKLPGLAACNPMFVWNHHLLAGIADKVHPDWILPITHGFVAQAHVSVYGKPIYLTVIARRSRQFAGTRFLKRGTNDQGYVANDVETEQIVYDASRLAHDSGRFTSFVQMRGSIPLFWSQDHSGMIPKPPIMIDRLDPFYTATGRHFDDMSARYGTPIIVLNLVKRKEKKPRESILAREFAHAVKYLNQLLPPERTIHYVAWDMARCAKSKDENVIDRVGVIAENAVNVTGFFHSGPQLYCTAIRNDGMVNKGGRPYSANLPGRLQRGILRVNCIDCLDRTNAVELMVGKSALAHQLFALGVIDRPLLEFDSDLMRVFEEIYEDHGDTIALQYGGSQAVNKVETYRKIAPWTTHSRDILNTIHRYYNNSFTDADKQAAINLFLGNFVPQDGKANLWDLPTDYFLHFNDPADGYVPPPKSYIKWCTTIPGGENCDTSKPIDNFFIDQDDELDFPSFKPPRVPQPQQHERVSLAAALLTPASPGPFDAASPSRRQSVQSPVVSVQGGGQNGAAVCQGQERLEGLLSPADGQDLGAVEDAASVAIHFAPGVPGEARPSSSSPADDTDAVAQSRPLKPMDCLFEEYYQPQTITCFHEVYAANMTTTERRTHGDMSPFKPRAAIAPKAPQPAPSIGAKKWLMIRKAGNDDADEVFVYRESTGDYVGIGMRRDDDDEDTMGALECTLPTMEGTYGTTILPPPPNDLARYKCHADWCSDASSVTDAMVSIEPVYPTAFSRVAEASHRAYAEHARVAREGASVVDEAEVARYAQYTDTEGLSLQLGAHCRA